MSVHSDAAAPPIASPCVGLCRLQTDQICEGCGRTLDEIAGWSQATPAQQRAIVERASRRRSALPPELPGAQS